MMRVFLDTNILTDWLQPDRQCHDLAKTILSYGKAKKYEVVISTQSILDSIYLLRKTGVNYNTFCQTLRHLRSFVRIVGIDDLDLMWAMDHFTGDFEDDAQYASAYNAVCDYFITRDSALFQNNSSICPMAVISPEDFVAEMMS